ncbi:MerR family transcriptional regulator [Nocardia brasiliensis]|uniref:MerR family transcriptional regulator n=1 Tax=Nocardia brasiliensis TaxID=37326 RepID=UPI00245485B5|nr:MerR family transcriptional regulator [Nocardia brasiliensis]
MAELSRASGIATATIKYYQRAGLMHSGEITKPNQAVYNESHLRRLALIRALMEVGGLSIAQTQQVLAAIDNPDLPVRKALNVFQRSLSRVVPIDEYDSVDALPDGQYIKDELARLAEARRMVDELVQRRGWQVAPENPMRGSVAGVIAPFAHLLPAAFENSQLLDAYAQAAAIIARADLGVVAKGVDRESMLEIATIGTVLGDALLAALRRLAQVDASHRLSGGMDEPPAASDAACVPPDVHQSPPNRNGRAPVADVSAEDADGPARAVPER